jgi:hypothetical protein
MRATTTLVLSGTSPTSPVSRAPHGTAIHNALAWRARKRGPRAAAEALLLVHAIIIMQQLRPEAQLFTQGMA